MDTSVSVKSPSNENSKSPSPVAMEKQSLESKVDPSNEAPKFRLTTQEWRVERIQLATLFLSMFNVGWIDGSTGPLVPTFQSFYHLNFTLVSLVFILNCLGALCGVAILVLLAHRVSFGKLIIFGATLSTVAAAIQASRPPYPAFVFAFWVGGIGLALQDAQTNSFVACLKEDAALKMGLLHAIYGLGALSSPLVATQFSALRHWSFFYLCSLGIAVCAVIGLFSMFRFKRQEDLIAQYDDGQTTDVTESKGGPRAIVTNRLVLTLAIFCFIYVGVEVTTGGWIVSFIIHERGGGHSSGYVSSGFFGGLTFGRVALLWVNKRVGEYRVVFIYAVLCIGLEIVIWQTRSLIGNAVAVSFIGMLLGPMYPIMISQAERVLPRNILTGGIGCIGALGATGSALFPFITGALAGRFGIVAMEPVLIILLTLLICLWVLVPSNKQPVNNSQNSTA